MPRYGWFYVSYLFKFILAIVLLLKW
jgi:hypothetical protein